VGGHGTARPLTRPTRQTAHDGSRHVSDHQSPVRPARRGLGGGAVAALAGAAAVRDSWDRIGVGDALGTVIGLLELAAAAGLLIGLRRGWSWLGTAAAAGLAALMLGAVIYHVRADDAAGSVPAALLGLVACTAVMLSWRDRRSSA
jgi:hypothetical protein